jgi:hypothetical protein
MPQYINFRDLLNTTPKEWIAPDQADSENRPVVELIQVTPPDMSDLENKFERLLEELAQANRTREPVVVELTHPEITIEPPQVTVEVAAPSVSAPDIIFEAQDYMLWVRAGVVALWFIVALLAALALMV